MEFNNSEKFINNLKELHSIIIDDYLELEELFDAILIAGIKIFNCKTGIISRIDKDYYTVWATKNDMNIKKGDVYELKNTFCNLVVEENKTISFHHGGSIDHIKNHPVYLNQKLETYISTPLFVNNKIFGTLNFSSPNIKEKPFEENENEFIEIMAKSISHYLEIHEGKEREAILVEKNRILNKAVNNLSKYLISPGVYYVSIPEAQLFILCGCPEDVTKHLMKKGIIVETEKDGIIYETGPNAILLSDSPVQNSQFSNLSEFPVLQMFYRQGMLIPYHPNNTKEKPIIMGNKKQVNSQLEYLHRGNYGLLSLEELNNSSLDKKTINQLWDIKKFFAYGDIKPAEELLTSIIIENDSTHIKNNVSIKRESHNVFQISFQNKSVTVNLNLDKNENYSTPYTLPYYQISREHFAIVHTGEGNGWDTDRPCMSSIIIHEGQIYIIDTGPNIMGILRSLGIDTSEIKGIFHTHSHDDHFAGLPGLMMCDHKIKYYSSKAVRLSVEKKLAALLAINDFNFENFFEVQDLKLDTWTSINGLNVKPELSPHPVETNIFHFKVEDEAGHERTYSHLADIASFNILDKMEKNSDFMHLDSTYIQKIKKNYLNKVFIKKIDIGGSLIHGEAKDFHSDRTDKILLAHKDSTLEPFEKEIGSEAVFGAQDVIIPAQHDYMTEKARYIIQEYFPDISKENINSFLFNDIAEINPGTVIIKKNKLNDFVYVILTGSVEFINTEINILNMIPAGSIIGDHPIIYGDLPVGTFRTLSHVTTLTIPRELFLKYLEENDLIPELKEANKIISIFKACNLFKEQVSFPVLRYLADNSILEEHSISDSINHMVETNLYIIRKGSAILNNPDKKKTKSLIRGDYFISSINNKAPVSIDSETEILRLPFSFVREIPVALWKFIENEQFN